MPLAPEEWETEAHSHGFSESSSCISPRLTGIVPGQEYLWPLSNLHAQLTGEERERQVSVVPILDDDQDHISTGRFPRCPM